MSKRVTAEQALAEAQARAAFKILSGQIEHILLSAGWSQAQRDGETVPFVRAHGDIIILAGNDAHGHNHSAASRHGLSLAEYLAALDLRLTPEPQPAQVETVQTPIIVETLPTPDLQSVVDSLRDENADLKAELERLRATPTSDVHNFPANLAEPMSGWSEQWDHAPEELNALREGQESIAQAKARLYPILNEELGRLKNEEALLGKTIPRRAEVESLLGILARVGEA